jgi:hypothetical protein
LGKSRWSRRSPRYAASANGRCSTQSKQNSGSSYRGCGAIRLAAVLLSFTMASRNSGSLFFSASVDGTHGGRKTVCVCPMNESLLSAMQRRSAATDAARCYCWWMQVSPQAKLAQAVAVGCCRSALGLFSVCAALLPPDAAACLLSARRRRRVDFRGRRNQRPTHVEQRSLTMRRVLVSAVRRRSSSAALGRAVARDRSPLFRLVQKAERRGTATPLPDHALHTNSPRSVVNSDTRVHK